MQAHEGTKQTRGAHKQAWGDSMQARGDSQLNALLQHATLRDVKAVALAVRPLKVVVPAVTQD
eukprot:360863-Chlamydomonas_euryale.AAC.5